MKLKKTVLTLLVFGLAAGLAVLSAMGGAVLMEERSKKAVRTALTLDGYDWVTVKSDGTLVHLSGTAEDEASRFGALRVAGRVVDSENLVDQMDVLDPLSLAPPHFSVEILRNDDEVSLIGLVPASTDRAMIVDVLSDLEGSPTVTDMLETANFAEPDGWDVALTFGLDALEQLSRSKISIDASRVAVTSIADSGAEKQALEAALEAAKPPAIRLNLDISAPRPAITPFTLRYILDAEGGRFDACSADTDEDRRRIIDAANAAGLTDTEARCTLGLGVPSPKWAEAVEKALKALSELGGGAVTFSDADVSLVALDTTPQVVFDQVIGELEASLPEVFSLNAVLPEKVVVDGTGESEVPEFVATLSPEGMVQLRGRLTTARDRDLVGSFARANFGSDEVYAAARIDPDLPDGWTVRVLSGLEALSGLDRGSLVVQADYLELRGETGNPAANGDIARLLSDKLGEGQNFDLNVTYIEAAVRTPAALTAEECITRINGILENDKIAFAPGKATLQTEAFDVIDRLAEAFEGCADIRIEIGGHTDSQGRESMNLNLSQFRADTVLNALLARDVLTTNLTAKGYGETQPIADNGTEEGREANRRIAFRLITEEETEAAAANTAEQAAAESEGAEEPHAADEEHPAEDNEGTNNEQN